MPGAGSRSDYGKVAQRIKDSLTSQMTIESVETCLSASIGIAVYPEDGVNAEALMMNADTAMYRAKHNGRNNIVYYDSSMNEELKSAIKMETDLRQAMRNNELYLEYQPIYNSASVEVAGVEALCRWRGKDGKMVPPDRFIPIAERAGLMHELGDQLLVLACMQLRQWLQEGRDIYVAVNISPAQFMDRNFPERVKQLIREFEIEPQRLQLELTERLLLDDSEDIVMMLNNLANGGIKLAVDDFGTGYSALSYLRKFPVHVLKVDRAFVHELPGSTRDQALVKAIITMAHSLGMSVVAEGVETREQCEFLQAQKCELMQGYLYGRPVPAEDLWKNSKQVVPLRNLSA
jgi:EAL domain-containing protein (putative c-di-GMP-specific phosphodiesterase class I)